MYFCYFVIISPWKRVGASFEHIWIPFTQGCFVPSLVKICPVVLEKKSQKRTDRQTDDGRQRSEKLTWALSSSELKRYFALECMYNWVWLWIMFSWGGWGWGEYPSHPKSTTGLSDYNGIVKASHSWVLI